MKRDFIMVFLFFVFLILPFVSSAQIDMKSNFSKGQTLMAQVSGNFLEQIQQQNVLLYEGHVRISFIPSVQKIQDKFYIYGQLLGKSEGNYSLVISGVTYSQSGQTYSDDITKNFTITSGMADFSISPGFLETAENFSINVQSLADSTITINSFIKNSTASENSGFFSLFGGSATSQEGTKTQISPGQIKSIPFTINNSYNNQLVYSVLETNNTRYEVPVFVSGQNESSPESQISFKFQPSYRNLSLATNSTTFIYLYLNNTGKENLTGISLSLSDNLKPYVSISNQTINLNSNSSIRIMANISSGPRENITEGKITAKYQNETSEFALSLNISKSYISPANGTSLFQTCAELGGLFCTGEQTCSGQIKNAQDGPCCIGACQTPNNSGKILGWALVAIIVLLIIVFFVLRYLKARRPFNLLDFAKKK